MPSIGLWGVPLAVAAGAVRAGTPFLFVSLGELLTEKSGRINLGLEGTLVMGAMSGYGIAYLTGSPWLGVLVAGLTGSLFGALHAGLCSLPKVNDIAVGIALMLFGTGLRLLSRQAAGPAAGADAAGDRARLVERYRRGRERAEDQRAVPGRRRCWRRLILWALRSTRWGMIVRMAGDSRRCRARHGLFGGPRAARRRRSTGGFLAGVGGSFLSLYYPGKLERGPVQRPGHHGGGAGDLRALEPDELPLRLAAVRRRRRARAGAAIGRRHLGLLPVQRRALFPDSCSSWC